MAPSNIEDIIYNPTNVFYFWLVVDQNPIYCYKIKIKNLIHLLLFQIYVEKFVNVIVRKKEYFCYYLEIILSGNKLISYHKEVVWYIVTWNYIRWMIVRLHYPAETNALYIIRQKLSFEIPKIPNLLILYLIQAKLFEKKHHL